MSSYENPPSDPYGASPQNPQDPYAQQPNPYGSQAYGQPGGVPQGVTFAHWGKRVAAALIDGVLMMLAYTPAIIGSVLATDPGTAGMGTILTLIGLVLYLAVFIWNVCIKQGNTGYSIGKGVMGIKLVKADTGVPIGAGMSFVRQLAHILDAIPCYVGFLWPLWDSKRQTFADKIIGTYVIDQPKG